MGAYVFLMVPVGDLLSVSTQRRRCFTILSRKPAHSRHTETRPIFLDSYEKLQLCIVPWSRTSLPEECWRDGVYPHLPPPRSLVAPQLPDFLASEQLPVPGRPNPEPLLLEAWGPSSDFILVTV